MTQQLLPRLPLLITMHHLPQALYQLIKPNHKISNRSNKIMNNLKLDRIKLFRKNNRN